MTIKEKFRKVALPYREEIRALRKAAAEMPLGEYTVGQAYRGAKGIRSIVYETSSVDPFEGIRYQGYSIPEMLSALPAHPEGGPYPEGAFYLLLMGKMPSEQDVKELTRELLERSEVPSYVFDVLDAMPEETHPMTQFSMAILTMEPTSQFAAAYREGISRYDLWEYMFEDVLNLLGRLPKIAAYIYGRMQGKKPDLTVNYDDDWAGNFANWLGFGEHRSFKHFLRLYLMLLADHEGGNVSAHTNRLVGSALSNVYLSFSAAMNGLAGPLHGLANQEVLRWILQMKKELGGTPTDGQLKEYVEGTLHAGRVIPGFGHGVLRRTDPRFKAQFEFAMNHLADDENVRIVDALFRVVPPILEATGKVKNPWPNVDLATGAIFYHYGLQAFNFYTVLFGVSRAIGTSAALTWDRVLMYPIERPKSITSRWIREQWEQYKESREGL